MCEAGLKLMTLILSWDFQRGGSNSSGGFGYVPEKDKAAETTIVHPGESWRSLLLAEEASDWVLALQEALKGQPSSLLPGIRQVLVQLSSLALDFFPQTDGGECLPIPPNPLLPATHLPIPQAHGVVVRGTCWVSLLMPTGTALDIGSMKRFQP